MTYISETAKKRLDEAKGLTPITGFDIRGRLNQAGCLVTVLVPFLPPVIAVGSKSNRVRFVASLVTAAELAVGYTGLVALSADGGDTLDKAGREDRGEVD